MRLKYMNEKQVKDLLHQYHVEMGRKGGSKIRDLRGSEYFAMLGKRSGESKRERIKKKQLSTRQFDNTTSQSYNKTNNKDT